MISLLVIVLITSCVCVCFFFYPYQIRNVSPSSPVPPEPQETSVIPEEEEEAISSSHSSDGGSQKNIVANSQSFSYPRCRAISPKERSLSEPAFTSADLMRWHKIIEEGKSIVLIVLIRSNTGAIFTDIWPFSMSSFIICCVI